MKKFSKKYVYYRLVSYLLYVFIGFQAFFGSFLGEMTDENGNSLPMEEFKSAIILMVIAALVLWVFLCVYGYLYYKTSGYELTDKEIICKRGVLFKTKSVIEYKKIHAVNQKHGLIQRMFGISTLLVDSGSTNTAMNAEIAIYEDIDIVNELYHRLKNLDLTEAEIKAKVNDEEKQEYLFNFTSKSKWLYSFINVISSLVGMLIAVLFIGLILGVINYCVDETEKLDFLVLVGIMVGLYFIVNLIVFITSTLYSFINLYDFKVTKEGNSLNINYGLFVRINNTFKLNRIKGVKIEQSLIKRIFGFATIKLEVIGYNHSSGNNEGNDANQTIGLLIPLCKLSEVEHYLDLMLPNYKPARQKGQAKSFNAFMITPTVIAFIILGIIMLILIPVFVEVKNAFFTLVMIGALCLSFILIEVIFFVIACFQKPNQDIVIEDDKITIYNGGMTKRVAVILKENLIAIEDITTYHRALKGIYSYNIHFHTNAMTNVVRVRMLDETLKEQLIEMLRF